MKCSRRVQRTHVKYSTTELDDVKINIAPPPHTSRYVHVAVQRPARAKLIDRKGYLKNIYGVPQPQDNI